MRISRPVVIGWALLAAGGWAATLWLGEPVATSGSQPAPSLTTRPAIDPGPQPEGGPCPDRRATPATTRPPTPTAPTAPTAWPSASTVEDEAHGVLRMCAYSVSR